MTDTTWLLKERQSLTLNVKIRMSEDRIKEWYRYYNGNVHISFSGGKDSTVLLHIARSIYPDIPAYFVDTGLEYPEIRQFVKTIDNVIWLKPKIHFKQVIEKYGYPVVSKENAQIIYEIRNTMSDKLRNIRLHGDEKGRGKLPNKWHYLINAPFKISDKCCYHIKERQLNKVKSNRIVGVMANESRRRKTAYKRYGCNVFSMKNARSMPLSFWMKEDIWLYIKTYSVGYSDIYNMGYDRTGCMFCMFGVHMQDSPNKFQLMKETHPKQYKFCIDKLGLGEVLDYINVPY